MRHVCAGGYNRSAGFFRLAEEVLYLCQLRFGDHGANFGVWIHGVTEGELVGAFLKGREEGVFDAFLDQDAASGDADLAGVRPDSCRAAFDSCCRICVFKDDLHAFAAEFNSRGCQRFGCRPQHSLACCSGSGEGDLIDVGGAGERFARGPAACHYVEHACRNTGLVSQVREQYT